MHKRDASAHFGRASQTTYDRENLRGGITTLKCRPSQIQGLHFTITSALDLS